MEKALFLNDKKYISAKRAAEISGYSSDYVGQLARAGKIDSVLVGRSWYVSEVSLLEHKDNHLSPYAKKSTKISPAALVEKSLSPVSKKISSKIQVESPVSKIPLLSYEAEDKPLFPTLKRDFDLDSTRYAVDTIVENKIHDSKIRSPYIEKFVKTASVVSICAVIVSVALLSDLNKVSFASSVGGFARSMVKSYSPIYELAHSAIGNVEKRVSNQSMLASVAKPTRWSSLSSWIKNVADQMIKPWLFEDKNSSVIVQNTNSSNSISQNIAQNNASLNTNRVAYYTNTYVEGTDREYVDMKIAELKDYFLTNPTAPNVTRYYVTNQNDSIVNSLSQPIRSLSDVTITGNSSFAGSAGLTTLSVSGSASFTGSSTMADLTVTEWLAVGTTTQYEALTLDGALYLGTNTAPTNTTYRLYNTNNGDLYWNGSLMAGATVGNWTTDGTNVWRTGGNVGVGTTSPFASLSVVGDAFITRNLTASNITATGTLNVSGLTTLGYASSTGLTVSGSTYLATAGGNVGIGTTNPTAKLEIAGGVSGSDPTPRIKLTDYYDSVGNPSVSHIDLYGGQYGFGISWDNLNIISAADFNFLTGATSRMVIKGGNVGIATTSPYRTLSVSGSGVFTGGDVLASTFTATSSITTPSLTLSSVAINSLLSTNASGAVVATSVPTFGNFNATSTAATSTIAGGLAIETSGFVYDYSTNNVGIGTASPINKLQLHQSASDVNYLRFTNSTTGTTASDGSIYGVDVSSNAYVWNYENAGLYFGTSGTSRMVIDGSGNLNINSGQVYVQQSSGNLGLATTSPYAKLSVVGSSGTLIGADAISGFTGTLLDLKLASTTKFSVDYAGNVTSAGSLTLSSVAINSLLSTNASGAVVATSVPTFGRFNATSTAATSTIAGGLAIETSGFVYDYSTNNVGIGTAAPAYKLHISGSSYTSGTATASAFSGNTVNLTVANNTGFSAGSTEAAGALNAYMFRQNIGGDTTYGKNYATVLSNDAYYNGTNWIRRNQYTEPMILTLGGDGTNTGVFRIMYGGFGAGSDETFTPTEYFRVNSSGNVGIGTTTPDSILTVNGGAAMTSGWNRTATLRATYPVLAFDSSATKWAGIGYDYTTAMRFWVNSSSNDVTAGTNAMTILNDGNVGIGTATPGDKLVVAGDTRVTGNLNVGYNQDPYHDLVIVNSGATPTLSIDRASVGVGGAAIDTAGNMVFGVSTVGTNADFTFRTGTTYSGDITTTGSEVMRIQSDGNFGIATTSPYAKLSVVGSSGTLIGADAISGFTGTLLDLKVASTTKFSVDYAGNITSAGSLTLSSVAINSLLSTNASGAVVATSAPTFGYFNATSTAATSTISGGLAIETSGFVYDYSTNNVGIGTASPGYKLDVAGSARLGSITAGDGLIINSPSAGIAQIKQTGNGVGSHVFRFITGGWGSDRLDFCSNENCGSTPSNMWMTINQGNVGIGTTSPYAKLSVVGDGVFTRNLNTANFLATGTATFTNLSQGVAYIGSNNLLQTAASSSIFGFTPISNQLTKGYFIVGDDSGVAQATSTIFISSTGKVGIASTTPYAKFSITNTSADPSFIVEDSASPDSSPFIIDASGNVGIGTTGPGDKLQINGSNVNTNTAFGSQLGIMLRNTDSTSGNYTSIINYNSGNTVNSGIYFKNIDQTYAGQIDFVTRSLVGEFGTRMSIDKSGNVGIGTTSPQAQLHVYGTGQLTSALTDAGEKTGTLNITGASNFAGAGGAITLSAKNDNGTNVPQWAIKSLLSNGSGNGVGDLAFSTRAAVGDTALTEKVRITTAGNVGIGTTGPGSALEIAAPSTQGFITLTSNNDASIARGNIIWKTSQGTSRSAITSGSNVAENDLEFYTGNTVFNMALRSNGGLSLGGSYAATTPPANGAIIQGNVGIGTTGPGTVLHVQSSNFLTAAFQGTSNASRVHFVFPEATNNTFDLRFDTGTAAGGNSTAAGIIRSTITQADSSTLKGDLSFFTNSGDNIAERMRIDNQGNVGIGTTSPWAKFAVTGSGTGTGRLLHLADSANTSRVTVLDNGNVGIGTVSPAGSLHVNSGQVIIPVGTEALPGLVFNESGYDTGIYNSSTDDIGFVTGSTKVMELVNIGAGAPFNGILRISQYSTGATADNYPGYSFLSDTDTGVTLFGTDQLSLTTGAATRLLVNASGDVGIGGTITNASTMAGSNVAIISGNVGIGTTSPWAKFAVTGSGTGTGRLLHLADSANTSRVTVLDNGNVGIGTTSPVSKLDVMGNGYFSSNLFVGGAITGTSTLTISGTGNSSIAGNVGIGTTNPGAKFVVSQSGDTYTDGLQLERTGANRANIFLSATTGNLNFSRSTDANNIKMVISNDGNVGIGTTSPWAKFAVTGSGTGTGRLLHLADSANTSRVTVLDNGNVGIGTTGPASKLHVSGDYITVDNTYGLVSRNAANNGVYYLISSDASNYARVGQTNGITGIRFEPGATEAMRITNQGNVGIGTTGPAGKLNVVQSSTGEYGLILDAAVSNPSTPVFALRNIAADGSGIPVSINTFGAAGVLSIGYHNQATARMVFNGGDAGTDANVKIFDDSGVQTINLSGSGASGNYINSGNVGIGTTSPWAKFAVTGSGTGTGRLLHLADSANTSRVTVLDNGNVGIGTTNPAQKLSVIGHCMTGDTLLPIRRRRRKGKYSTNGNIGTEEPETDADKIEYDYMFVAIKDIQPGDEVLSLDEATNTAVYKRINALMDMGVREIFEVRTKSGRVIRTTAEHPYLARKHEIQSAKSKTNLKSEIQNIKNKLKNAVKNGAKFAITNITNSIFGAQNYEIRDISTQTSREIECVNSPSLTLRGGRGELSSRSRDCQDLEKQETHSQNVTNELRDVEHCPYCSSTDFVKRGTRKNKNQTVQLYLCRNTECQKTFTASDVKGKHFPLRTVIEGLSLYNLGFTLEQVCKVLKQKFKVGPEPATLSDWTNEYKSLCTFHRLREYAIKYTQDILERSKLGTKDHINRKSNSAVGRSMIEVVTMAHRQLYRFRYHRAKIALMLEEFGNRNLKPLKEYLDNVSSETPHQYFADGERMSEVRSKFDKADMIVRGKQNYANKLAGFVLQAVKDNKQRHEEVQRFMIANDSVTVATEVPVYIRREDVVHMENVLKFKISDNGKIGIKGGKEIEVPKLLTGHVDFVQIRNGSVHLLDYKPNAAKEKPVEQLTWYALALSRLTGLRLFEFKCAWFDEKDYFEFFPLHVVKKLQRPAAGIGGLLRSKRLRRRIVHFRDGSKIEVPKENELVMIRNNSPDPPS